MAAVMLKNYCASPSTAKQGILARHQTTPRAQRARPVRCQAGKDSIRAVGRAEPAVLSVLALATGFSVLLEPSTPSNEDTAAHLEMVEMAGTTFSYPQPAIGQATDAVKAPALTVAYNDLATLAAQEKKKTSHSPQAFTQTLPKRLLTVCIRCMWTMGACVFTSPVLCLACSVSLAFGH